MIKRALVLLLALTLLLAAAAGCSLPVRSEVTQVEDSGETAVDANGDAETDAAAADSAGPAALEPETDGEKEALALAESDEARTWASGDVQNGTPVAGEPFLVGYGILLHDGSTQYQVSVFDGEVVGFFSNTNGQRYVEAPFANYNPTIEPASARQTEAFEAAKAEIAGVNAAATQGGIEYYAVFYPSEFEGTFPHVAIYASPDAGAGSWAMGGSFGWQ
ncbi:MAG: hypothetical protein WBJ62_03980 [Coriobacteriia bacterium]|jgi:hypothetical protein